MTAPLPPSPPSMSFFSPEDISAPPRSILLSFHPPPCLAVRRIVLALSHGYDDHHQALLDDLVDEPVALIGQRQDRQEAASRSRNRSRKCRDFAQCACGKEAGAGFRENPPQITGFARSFPAILPRDGSAGERRRWGLSFSSDDVYTVV